MSPNLNTYARYYILPTNQNTSWLMVRKYNQGVKYWNTEIMTHPELTLNEKIVMNLILNLCWATGETEVDNGYFNKTLGFKASSTKNLNSMISRIISSLGKKGFIEREMGNFNPAAGKQERLIKPTMEHLPMGYRFREVKIIHMARKR